MPARAARAAGARPVGGALGLRRVELTSRDRVLWPLTGFTKGALIDYYASVAGALLGHLARRALTLGRFPGGVDARGFAQTECRGCPEWMATHPLALRDGRVRRFCVVQDRPSLLWVANQSAIELHQFLATIDDHQRPTALLLDLDPGPGAGMLECCAVALRARALLRDEHGLEAFVKTSGSAGLHVLVPVDAPRGYEQTKPFARELAARLAAEDPAHVVDRTPRALRHGRVLVDWLQNDASRTLIAPYSLRAADRPTVSTPVTWDEVEAALRDGAPERLEFTAADIVPRLEAMGDPLAPALALRQRPETMSLSIGPRPPRLGRPRGRPRHP